MNSREFYIAIGICPVCNKNTLYGEEKACLECRARDAEYHARRYENPGRRKQMIQINTESKKKRKQYRREQGLCIECGKRKPKEGIATCSICRAHINQRKRMKYQGATLRKQWVADGKCFFCGGECETGYKVCREHHQMYIDNAQSEASVANRKRIKERRLVDLWQANTSVRDS